MKEIKGSRMPKRMSRSHREAGEEKKINWMIAMMTMMATREKRRCESGRRGGLGGWKGSAAWAPSVGESLAGFPCL